MRPFLLLTLALAACSAQDATNVSPRASEGAAPSSSESFSSIPTLAHSVTGSGIQRIGPGFAYGLNVSVHSDASGRVTGTIVTHIIDLRVYGYPGHPEIVAEATCMRVVGRTAWINAVVKRSTDPIFAPVGSRSIFWVRDGGERAADVGHAGPGFLDPDNTICTSMPVDLPSDPVTSGNFIVR